MRKLGASLLAGLLFGLGLALAGMTLPSRVLGFLDVTGAWDPSLALVMVGAGSGESYFVDFFTVVGGRSTITACTGRRGRLRRAGGRGRSRRRRRWRGGT